MYLSTLRSDKLRDLPEQSVGKDQISAACGENLIFDSNFESVIPLNSPSLHSGDFSFESRYSNVHRFSNGDSDVNIHFQEIVNDQERENEKIKDPPEYCSVVKKEKNKNITPENIGTILLCQIPLVHSVSAIAIMEKFSSIHHLITSLIDNPNCLNEIYTETNGKKRKLSKTMIQNIKKFLLPMDK